MQNQCMWSKNDDKVDKVNLWHHHNIRHHKYKNPRINAFNCLKNYNLYSYLLNYHRYKSHNYNGMLRRLVEYPSYNNLACKDTPSWLLIDHHDG